VRTLFGTLFRTPTSRTHPLPSSAETWREGACVVAGLAIVALVVTYPLGREITRALPSDLGDPLLWTWILAWGADRLQHGLQDLWNAPFFYPYEHTLAYSEHLLGIAIFTAPIQWLSGNPVLVHNVAFLSSYVLAGAGMYLLVRSLTGNRLSAAALGLAFAFLPYRATQVSHLQVLMHGWMPVALWALHRYFAAGSWRALALFVVAYLLLGMSNGYYLYFFALPVAAVVAFELLRRPEHRMKRIAQLAVGATVMGLLLAPIVLIYYQARVDQGLFRPRDGLLDYSADVSSYLHASRSLALWGDVLPRARPELGLFPGFAMLGLASVGLVVVSTRRPGNGRAPHRFRAITFLYAGIAIAAFVLTLGPEPTAWGHRLLASGPYDWLHGVVPGFDGLRVPARMAAVVYLGLAVVAAVGLTTILERVPGRVGAMACVLVSVAVVVEGYASPFRVVPFQANLGQDDDSRAYRWLSTAPPGAVLELPAVTDEPIDTLRYQYRTLHHRHPIVNGYSGYPTRLFLFLTHPDSPLYEVEQFDDLIAALSNLGVRYIVVHEARFDRPELAQATTAALKRHTAQLAGVIEFGRTTVYWLTAGARGETPAEGLRQIPRSQFGASASSEMSRLERAFDGDLTTGWYSGEVQTGRERIELRFDRPINVGRVRLEMSDQGLTDYPRGVRIEGSADGQAFEPLYEGEVLSQLLRARVRHVTGTPIDIALPENETTVLRIGQTEQSRVAVWSVHELSVWERAPGLAHVP
jgi:hypothetical protein